MAQGFFGENRDTSGVPGDDGWPLIGYTLNFYKDFYQFGSGMLARFGEIYHSSAALMKFITVASPDAVDFVLRQHESIFSCKEGWEPFYGRVFPNSLPVMNDTEHRHHRRILQSAFKKSFMVKYAELIDDIACPDISSWPAGTRVEMFNLCKQLTLDVAARAFLGISLQEKSEFVGRTFLTLNQGIGALIPVPVPGFALWNALKAQKALLDFFRPMVSQKRGKEGDDMFSRLCNARDEADNYLSDDAIVFHLLQFLAAAHDTSTTTLSAIFHYLMKNPEWEKRISTEVDSLGKERIGYDDLDVMPITEMVIKEALRLHPAVPMMFRRATSDCEYKGHKIRAGNQIVIDVAAIHHSPDYWRDPWRFDPDRFSEQRNEHKNQTYLWIPFGGGAHTCMGLNFTFVELKIILFHVFKRFHLEAINGEEDSFQVLPITKPRKNLPLRLVRRN